MGFPTRGLLRLRCTPHSVTATGASGLRVLAAIQSSLVGEGQDRRWEHLGLGAANTSRVLVQQAGPMQGAPPGAATWGSVQAEKHGLCRWRGVGVGGWVGGESLAALALSSALGRVLATLASSPESLCPGALIGTQCSPEGSPCVVPGMKQ